MEITPPGTGLSMSSCPWPGGRGHPPQGQRCSPYHRM